MLFRSSTTIARKLLSAVARTGQRYGAAYVADVARGAETEEIARRGHASLPTYGVLRGEDRATLINYVFQLVEHGLLARTEDEHPVLQLTDEGARALRGGVEVPLRAPPKGRSRKHATAKAVHGAHEVDTALFDRLRSLRRELAEELDLIVSDDDLEQPDGDVGEVPERFQVLITCTDEGHQTMLLEELENRGIECRAVVS